MVFKKILLIFFFLFIFPVSSFAKDKPQVVFINQVRGEECCSKGTLDNLKKQIDAFVQNKIPAYFAIRYDALTDDNYAGFLKQQAAENPDLIKLALMIEITPRLAKDSGVIYNDTEERWFEAQNSFTIGYQIDDRKKIIDKLFSAFKKDFGFYPGLTSAWMVDTNSLNYMHDKYKVLAHQITREQWGQDTYTLYGGPPHYPYPASRNWVFIPDFDQKDPVLMLRQTVTDPLYNYGETKKAYTSQTNDYLNAGLDFEYFKKLANQALFEQKTTGFALLGLENANDEKYQDEFLKQIEYVNQLKDKIIFPDLQQLAGYWPKQKNTSYSGRDLFNNTDNRAEFITGPGSRQRIRIYKGKTFITDYRYYDKNLTDPYNGYVAKKYGYWIAPYAIDYSHVYKPGSIFADTQSDLVIEKLLDNKIKKLDAEKFNKNRLDDYPYFMPEPVDRNIDRIRSRVEINYGKTIEIKFSAKDRLGYPVSINKPLTIKTDPKIEDIVSQTDSAEHFFYLLNNKEIILVITLTSDKKTVKQIFLFPKLFPFVKLSF